MPHTLRPELQKALDELNPQQRSAVEQTEGPVMVIAGPGTGKTQILAARIGRILSHPDLGDVRPDQVLCLTYTDAGAVAMPSACCPSSDPMPTGRAFSPFTRSATR
jgi:DNA helicase-2/ATP-dependent DNA helicase PcrA